MTPELFVILAAVGFVVLLVSINLLLFWLWKRERRRWVCPMCAQDMVRADIPVKCPSCRRRVTPIPVSPGAGRFAEVLMRANQGVTDYERDDPKR